MCFIVNNIIEMVEFLEDTELVIDHTNLASYTAMQLWVVFF